MNCNRRAKLPGILWAVLILGGVITTLSSCLFGTENFKLHCVQVISLTLLLSLALVAIARNRSAVSRRGARDAARIDERRPRLRSSLSTRRSALACLYFVALFWECM